MQKEVTEIKTKAFCDFCGEESEKQCAICGKDICDEHATQIGVYVNGPGLLNSHLCPTDSSSCLAVLNALKDASETLIKRAKYDYISIPSTSSEKRPLVIEADKITLKPSDVVGFIFYPDASPYPSISDTVRGIIDEFLADSEEMLLVEDVVNRVEAQMPLWVKNKPAVIASFLGRDQRLRRVAKGKFIKNKND